jgi:hypothetical protein
MYLLLVVELRNRSINSWLILVPPGAAMIFLLVAASRNPGSDIRVQRSLHV